MGSHKQKARIKLDKYEKELEHDFEKSKSIDNFSEEIKKYRKAAADYLRKEQFNIK